MSTVFHIDDVLFFEKLLRGINEEVGLTRSSEKLKALLRSSTWRGGVMLKEMSWK